MLEDHSFDHASSPPPSHLRDGWAGSRDDATAKEASAIEIFS